MKINENLANNNDNYYINKFDFSKNDSFGLPIQNKSSKNLKEQYKNNINESNDPRLNLTLQYLDIDSTLPTFITNNISFNDLLLLSKNDLVELGFSLVERNRILHFSQEFKQFGKKYNIEEIHNFFNEFQNLNIKLIKINNNDLQNHENKKENQMNNYNNENYDYFNNYNIKNHNNLDIPNTNSLYLEDKYHNYQNELKNNDFINNNKSNNQLNNINNNNKDLFLKDNYITSNNIKNKNIGVKYPELIKNNINHNNNFQDKNSSKLVRQNSKTSKNSNYSKNSKSRLITISKNVLPSASTSGSIVQKYKNLSEEIDNYFKKYNNYKESKKNKMKNYQIITSSSNSKKNYSPIFYNNNNNLDKKKNNNNISNLNNIDKNMNNFNESNMEEKRNKELSEKLEELQKRKKKLQEKLNTVCDKENKKKMIIKYLEEEEDNK